MSKISTPNFSASGYYPFGLLLTAEFRALFGPQPSAELGSSSNSFYSLNKNSLPF
jgi:hypothetical protein